MDIFDELSKFLGKNEILVDIIYYLIIISVILITIQYFRKFLKKNIALKAVRYKSQKAVEVLGYFFIITITLFYLTGNIKDFTIIVGLLTAGLAFTLQELILSVAGSAYIFLTKVYKPGDRVEINGVKGDVIDVDSVYTTMMEIGQWVSSDNYSGRIIKLSNAFVFKGPIYNYSQDFPFIWDEIDLPIRYGSDMELATSLVLTGAKEILLEYTTESRQKWNTVVSKYYIEDAILEPTLAIHLTDNWIRLNLRYIVDYRKRRLTKNLLNHKIYQDIKNTKGKVFIASTTLEVITYPEPENGTESHTPV